MNRDDYVKAVIKRAILKDIIARELIKTAGWRTAMVEGAGKALTYTEKAFVESMKRNKRGINKSIPILKRKLRQKTIDTVAKTGQKPLMVGVPGKSAYMYPKKQMANMSTLISEYGGVQNVPAVELGLAQRIPNKSKTDLVRTLLDNFFIAKRPV